MNIGSKLWLYLKPVEPAKCQVIQKVFCEAHMEACMDDTYRDVQSLTSALFCVLVQQVFHDLACYSKYRRQWWLPRILWYFCINGDSGFCFESIICILTWSGQERGRFPLFSPQPMLNIRLFRLSLVTLYEHLSPI